MQCTVGNRRRWISVVSLAAVLAGGWWLWHYLHQYRLVASFPCNADVQANSAGFLCAEDCRHFVFRDWNGVVRWRVDTRSLSHWSSPYPYAISTNGKILAAITTQNKRWICVEIWREGRYVGYTDLPDGFNVSNIWALDNGQAIISGNDGKGQVLLTDCRTLTCKLPGYDLEDLLPDGQTAIASCWTRKGQRRFAVDLLLQNGKLVVTNRFSLPRNYLYDIGQLYAKSTILDTDGSVYRHGQKVAKSAIYSHSITSPGKQYAMMVRRDHVIVYSPVTGDKWGFTLKKYASGLVTGSIRGAMSISNDGRFIVVNHNDTSTQHIKRLLSSLRCPTDWLPESDGRPVIDVYQRPGRRIASFAMNPSLSIQSCDPSPDGMQLLAHVQLANSSQNPDKDQYEAFLYRRRW